LELLVRPAVSTFDSEQPTGGIEMKKGNLKVLVAALFLMMTASAAVLAQPGEDKMEGRTFRTSLYVLSGGSSSGGSAVPDTLKDAVREIDKIYGLKSYRLVSEHFQTFGAGGMAQSNSILKGLGDYTMENRPVFTEWQLGPIAPVQGSARSIMFMRFNYKARVPSAIGNSVDYSSIETAIHRFSLKLGKASVVATMQVPQTDAMLFFVLAAEEADAM
jgi:hypothetical protein